MERTAGSRALWRRRFVLPAMLALVVAAGLSAVAAPEQAATTVTIDGSEYPYGTSAGAVRWNTGATDTSTAWTFEPR